MNPAYPRLFVTDLDGTLLTDSQEISPVTRRALDAFISRGNYFSISTGRALESAQTVQRTMHLAYPGSFIISYNGAHILDTDSGQTIFRTGIPLPVVAEIQQLAQSMQVHCQTYSDTHIIAPEINECVRRYTSYIKTPVLVAENLAEALSEPPCKMLGLDLSDHEKLEAFRRVILERWGDILTCTYSNPLYLEIIRKEAGKGQAVRRICEHLHIPVENAIAAGDGLNDISMIEAAGLGIAMCNGDPAVIRAADAVTAADNNHDGLAPFLQQPGVKRDGSL